MVVLNVTFCHNQVYGPNSRKVLALPHSHTSSFITRKRGGYCSCSHRTEAVDGNESCRLN